MTDLLREPLEQREEQGEGKEGLLNKRGGGERERDTLLGRIHGGSGREREREREKLLLTINK